MLKKKYMKNFFSEEARRRFISEYIYYPPPYEIITIPEKSGISEKLKEKAVDVDFVYV